MNNWKNHLYSALITLAVAAVGFYFLLPAISIHNPQLLLYIGVLVIIYNIALRIFGGMRGRVEIVGGGKHFWKDAGLTGKISYSIIGILIVTFLIGTVTGMVMFNADKYKSLLEVNEGNFTEDVEEISYDQIPTLDRESAKKLGDRKMGELSDMVSQFSVRDNYTQINYKGTPTRVTPLGYADVFKWFGNVSKGIPAYISIDMVSQEVTVHRLKDNIMYSQGDHFGRNIYRHLRFNYPTYVFEQPNFEIDENGTPYWVCSRVKYRVGLYGGKDVAGAVLVNAITGEHQYYELKDIPTWVDRAFDAELIIEQYDYYGTLQQGFWNSIFGQKNCKQTTDGYNYIAIDDDVYMYTGVTSMAEDASNVGFILTNQRTKATKFYSISGAEEYSAMASAEGEVQNLRYTATFPLLMNISGEPTYFVALKDEAGLVKMYAFVNVQQYQIVGKGQTPKECEENYTDLLVKNGVLKQQEESTSPTETTHSLTDTIKEIRSAVLDGNTYLYFIMEESDLLFSLKVAEHPKSIVLNAGDRITVHYGEENADIIEITKIEIAETADKQSDIENKE